MKVEKVTAESLFVTPEFRQSEWIAQKCADVGDIWITRDPMPPGHFGTYFGAMGVRDTYENPYIGDLYHLHELTHAGATEYDPGRSFTAWSKHMISVEFLASLTSECLAYLMIAGLRDKTFKHEIWVDRFLNDRDFDRIIAQDPSGGMTRAIMIIRKERERAFNVPHYDNFLEHQIWNYCRQNVHWCRIWAGSGNSHAFGDKPAFRVVEEHMSSPDRDANHQEWLDSVSVYDSAAELNIPFYYQAKEFTEVYRQSGALYGNWLLET